MQKIMTKLAVAGGLLLATASSSMAVSLSTSTGSIDFDPGTFTFSNWVLGSSTQVDTLSYAGVGIQVASETLGGIPGLQAEASYALDNGGVLDIVFTGDTLAMNLSDFEPISTFVQKAVLTNGGTFAIASDSTSTSVEGSNSAVELLQSLQAANGQLTGDFVIPTPGSIADGYTLTYVFNPQLDQSNFSSVVSLTENTNVIPEPITAALGMAGIGMLGLRLTGRRSR